MNDFLSFRRMVTPVFIQAIFWLFAAGLVVGGLITMVQSSFFAGLVILVVGPLMARIYCELLIILFRIYDELVAIRTGAHPSLGGQGFPITPNAPTQVAPPPYAAAQ
jgi:hypothetical protein